MKSSNAEAGTLRNHLLILSLFMVEKLLDFFFLTYYNFSDMSKEALILQTKLIPPQIKGRILRRERLLNLLKENLDKKLILICGGAGYGKTTLISQYLKELKYPFLFYRVDEEDSNPFLFLWSFITGIEQKVKKGFGRRAKELLKQYSQSHIPLQPLKIILNDLNKIRSDILIVFDDYHNIEDTSETHKFVDYLLIHSLDKVHFIFLSRSEPSLPTTPKIKLAGNFFEIKERDLCFSREEVYKLLKKVKAVSLQKPEYELLLEYTEGWITGIQIILQRLGEKPLIEIIEQYRVSGKEIFEYFINEVFNYEPENIKKLLVQSSIFDEINEKICREVLGVKNARETLRYLENRHLFISCINPVKGYFRYHPLFRDFLLKKISQEKANALYKKAGRFYLNFGDITRAFLFFMKGESYKEAEKLLKEGERKILRNIPLGLAQDYIEKVAQNQLKKFPYFLLLKAENLLLNKQNDETERVLLLAKKQFGHLGNTKALHQVNVLFTLLLVNKKQYKAALKLARGLLKVCEKDSIMTSRIMNTIAGIYFGERNYEEGQKYLEGALSTIRDKGFYEIECSLQGNLAVLKCQQGDCNDAYKELCAIYEKYRFHFPFKLGVPCVNLILLEITMRKLTDAQIHSEWLISIAQKYQMDYFLLWGIALSGLITSYLGYKNQSEKSFQQAIELSQHSFPYVPSYIYELKFQHHLYHKEIECAEKIFTVLSQEKEIPSHLPLYGAKLCYEKGELSKALDYLNQAVNKAKEIKDKFYEAESLLWLTKILLSLNKKEKAKQPFLSSLKIAKEKGYDYLIKSKEFKKFISAYPEIKESSHTLEAKKIKLDTEEAKIVVPDIKIYFFGSLNILINDKELIIHWHSEKVLSLFAYLCARQGKHSVDRLLEEFWPEKNPEKSRKTLYANISYIRKYLKPYLQMDIIKRYLHTYFLNPSFTFYKDTQDFENNLKQALSFQNKGNIEDSISKYEYARKLYKGDFLENLYDTWVEEETEYYHREYLNILKNLGALYKKTGKPDEASEIYEFYLNKNPYEEEIYFVLAEILTQLKQKKRLLELEKRYAKAMEEVSLTPDLIITNKIKKFLSFS
jgi:LuxR family maltose regulon positive regulatory protein